VKEDNIPELNNSFISYLSKNKDLLYLIEILFYCCDRVLIQNETNEVVIYTQIIIINKPWETTEERHNAVYTLQKTNNKDDFLNKVKVQLPELDIKDVEQYNIIETTYYTQEKSTDIENMDQYKLVHSQLVLLSTNKNTTVTVQNHDTMLLPTKDKRLFENTLTKEEKETKINYAKKFYKDNLSKHTLDMKDGTFKFVTCSMTNKIELPLRNILYLQYVQLCPPNKCMKWIIFNST